MPERISFFGAVFADPWRKLFSVALAAVLWTVLHRQLMDSDTIVLGVSAVSDRDLPTTEVMRRDRLYIVQTDEWRLVKWGDEPFVDQRKVTLAIEAPNDVLAAFRVNPFGVAGPFDFESYDKKNDEDLTVPLDLSGGPLIFGRSGSLRDARLRIDGAEKIPLVFRRYKRAVLSLSLEELAIEGLDEQTHQIDFTKSRVEPERIAIRMRYGAELPPTSELFAPIQAADTRDRARQLVRTKIWEELDLHYEDAAALEPMVRLAFVLKADARLPEPLQLTFNPAKKVQGIFIAVDAELPINPRDYVDFEPLQIDQVLLRWKRPPTPEDQAELIDRAPDLQRFLYFSADLSAMLDFDGPPPEPEPEASTEARLPFRILPHDIRSPIEVRRRKDIPPDLAALLEWVEVVPAGAAQVHCWRRP